jgi:predicted anti-sigma-YlaC factor YlaD
MTCDDAFDMLTDPSGTTDPRLWAHLDRCPRCRAMHETLAPAIGLFHGAGQAAVAVQPATRTAHAAADRLTQQGLLRARAVRAVRRARVCAAAAIALSVVAFSAVWINRREVANPSAASLASQCLWLSRADARPQPPQAAALLMAQCAVCHGGIAHTP